MVLLPIFCYIENEILSYTVQFLIHEGYYVDVLVFDGCMVRKDESKEITDELLNKLNVFIC